MSDAESRELLGRYEAGDADAAVEIFERYTSRLLALARSRIGPVFNARIDPEDIVQSAYRSFFVHARAERYELDNVGDLWRLLAGTTMNKLRRQVERHSAAKRSVRRELPQQQDDSDCNELGQFRQEEPNLADVIAVGEHLSLLLEHMPPDEQFVLVSTLHGLTTAQIASQLESSDRTIRRTLATARTRFEELIEAPTRPRSAPVEVSAKQAPLQYADYTLNQLIGVGAMGKVYRATSKLTGKVVALKALHKARQTEPRAVKQLIHEATVMKQLSHPNIISVHGLGKFPGGGVFFVMDLVHGENLQVKLGGTLLAPSQATKWSSDISLALQHSHDHGIIHCDIKPANILIDDNGRAVVTDFGFAWLKSAEKNLRTALGGTEGYLAPEVYDGEPVVASDIYSLGVLIRAMLARVNPYSTRSSHLKDLAAIAERCTASKACDRVATMSEVREFIRKDA